MYVCMYVWACVYLFVFMDFSGCLDEQDNNFGFAFCYFEKHGSIKTYVWTSRGKGISVSNLLPVFIDY